MPTYLTNWNPDRFKWENNAAQSSRTRTGTPVPKVGALVVQRRFVLVIESFSGGKERSPRMAHWPEVSSDQESRSRLSLKIPLGYPARSTTHNMIDFDTILTPDLVLPASRVEGGAPR